MSDWAAVAGTLGGVLVTLLATNARDQRRFRGEKLWKAYEDKRLRVEQLYGTLERHREEYRATCAAFVEAIGAGERPTSVRLPPSCDSKVAMLVGLYVTILEPALSDIHEKEQAFAETVTQVFQSSDDDGALTPKRERALRVMAASLLTSRFNDLTAAIRLATSALRTESGELERRHVTPLRARRRTG